MQLGLVIAVALLVIAVVAWPLVMRHRAVPSAKDMEVDAPDAAAALNDVYDAIRTLQTEHDLGRVSDADYREQLDEYRRQAAALLRDMDDAKENDRCP